MAIPPAAVMSLRERTGLGMMDCKQALVECAGDVDGAIAWLRKKGMLRAAAKGERAATEGAIGSYVHTNGKIGVLVELACETDFVTRSEEFRSLLRNLSLQICGLSPDYVRREDVPPEVVARERSLAEESDLVKGKPPAVREKIVTGILGRFYKDKCLLEQPYRDEKRTVAEVLQEAVSKIGENITVRRFVRMSLGG
ncbi:MAG: elongation factor Ts [Planctomycetes bacterium]|nr:elongation factor Ts [Planctomycetota bacterium]